MGTPGRRPFVDRAVDCAIWVIGFCVAGPVILMLMGLEMAWGLCLKVTGLGRARETPRGR